MFKESIIKECFPSLAQFTQPADPKIPTLDVALKTSVTGRAINRVHSLLSIENIFNVAPVFNGYTFPEWVSGTALKKGDRFTYKYKDYLVMVDLTEEQNVIAPAVSAQFNFTNHFSAWLQEICEQSAIELATLLLQHKKLSQMTKDILESTVLYQGGGLFTEREIKQSRFVGYKIEPRPNQNLLTTIDSIGIQLDGVLPSLDIYLYHSSKAEPVATAVISGLADLSFKWTEIAGFDLRSVDFKNYNSGGYFYLGYYEDDLAGTQAISKQMDISKPCSLCNRFNAQAYRTWSKRFTLESISVPTSGLNVDKKLFDTSKVVVDNNKNYGLNLSMTVACDTSAFFCKHRTIFADAYAKLVGVNLMKEIANTTRLNAIPEMIRNAANSELDPKRGSGSMVDEFNKALMAVDYDFSGLDSDCLPCTNARQRFTYGAI